MHFVDKDNFPNPPTDKLQEFTLEYKDKWIIYQNAKVNATLRPSQPPSSWLHDDVRKPLEKLFIKTCGYCGIHTKIGSDGEVDHHLPIDKDNNADYILNWENYIWSCHSCNNIKRNHYPFLNPCIEDDMKYIYFHSSDGKYLYYKDSPSNLINKFEITDKHSNINYSNRHKRRKLIYKDVTENHLSRLRIAYEVYKRGVIDYGELADDTQNKLNIFNTKKESFLELIDCGDYLFLIKYAFELFCDKNNFKFPFTFKDLLSEVDFNIE